MEVIRVEALSKLYDLGQVGTGTISKDLNRWWARMRGKNDPYAKLSHTNDRTQRASKDESVWAIRDINFSVNQGEVVGIIGRNGAGKSTLLKIISRITAPTTGAVKVRGRIASLLEVGTGFHPEMTGRENIFMNGTLLGMTRREIQSKLDEIVDFAGVAKYIDTPVKRYSSGMQVRLAFAVAAFLEPEILIVDEVLAVGDAEFQKKAIGRMQEISKGDGRTILFVSHNIGAVKNLCNKGILMDKGTIDTSGPIDEVVNKYLQQPKVEVFSIDSLPISGPLSELIKFTGFFINQKDPLKESITILPQDELAIELFGLSHTSVPVRIAISVYSEDSRLFTLHNNEVHKILNGDFHFKFRIPANLLRPGAYSLGVGAHSVKDEWSWGADLFGFDVLESYDIKNDRRNAGLLNIQPLTIIETN